LITTRYFDDLFSLIERIEDTWIETKKTRKKRKKERKLRLTNLEIDEESSQHMLPP
jgi:hypothetical protein